MADYNDPGQKPSNEPRSIKHCDLSFSVWTPAWEWNEEYAGDGHWDGFWVDRAEPDHDYHLDPHSTGRNAIFHCRVCRSEWEDIILASLLECYPAGAINAFIQESSAFIQKLKKN